MTPPRLSVCIPTFNRAALLRRSLAALAKCVVEDELRGQVEVCISDNASTDETPAVIAAAVAEYPQIQWVVWRNPTNVGALVNILKVAERANGTYLSITGDDDQVKRGALRTLVEATQTEARLILVNSLPGQGAWLHTLQPADGTRRWLFGLPQVNAELGLFHPSFLGNLVFRRDVYHAHRRNEFTANAYPHTWVAVEAMRDGPTLFVNIPLYEVDDSSRTWRIFQPRYTCLDMAIVQTVGLKGARRAEVESAYRHVVRSVPRAVFHGRQDSRAGVRVRELLPAYRLSILFQAIAIGLWLVASVSTTSLLRMVFPPNK